MKRVQYPILATQEQHHHDCKTMVASSFFITVEHYNPLLAAPLKRAPSL